MFASRTTLLAAAMSCLALATGPRVGVAADAPAHDHSHGAGAATANEPKSEPPAEAMKQMQTMHQKMMAAKTPEERQALMAEHMAAMQQGMQAMQHMGAMSCADQVGSQMRMDMMSMMMQMMMDRQQMGGMRRGHPATPPDSTKK